MVVSPFRGILDFLTSPPSLSTTCFHAYPSVQSEQVDLMTHSTSGCVFWSEQNRMKLLLENTSYFSSGPIHTAPMSKSTSLSGTAIDFSLIRSAVKDDLVSLLQEVCSLAPSVIPQIEGPKCVVLDMSLSKSINTALEGASIFKVVESRNQFHFRKIKSSPSSSSPGSLLSRKRDPLSLFARQAKTLQIRSFR